jgi:hypothetical protein
VPLSDWFVQASAADLVNLGFNLLYATSALLTAIGLWEMRPWSTGAYAAWATLYVTGIATKDAALKLQGVTDSDWWTIAIAPGGLAIVLVVVGVALSRALKRAA